MPVEISKIGKYDVLGIIGKGGMGIVYKAVDPRIGRFVAIKMITSGFSGNPDSLKRFYREAQSTGNLQNPNIVTVYELGDQAGKPYLVMEYLGRHQCGIRDYGSATDEADRQIERHH